MDGVLLVRNVEVNDNTDQLDDLLAKLAELSEQLEETQQRLHGKRAGHGRGGDRQWVDAEWQYIDTMKRQQQDLRRRIVDHQQWRGEAGDTLHAQRFS